jgi:hypothetical protein
LTLRIGLHGGAKGFVAAHKVTQRLGQALHIQQAVQLHHAGYVGAQVGGGGITLCEEPPAALPGRQHHLVGRRRGLQRGQQLAFPGAQGVAQIGCQRTLGSAKTQLPVFYPQSDTGLLSALQQGLYRG